MNDNKDHLRALLSAFNAEAGIELPLSPDRERILRHLDRRGLTPADVTAVMKELKRLHARDAQRYPAACLQFANAIANVDRFEERALLLRKRTKSVKAANKAAIAPKAPPVAPVEEERLRAQGKRAMEEFRRRMGT